MIELSVIIANWNTRITLRNCLCSLLRNIGNIPTEIIVVDNGSTDGSQHMIRKEFPEVVLIENHQNLGFAKANNIAMQQAAGEFFLLLNSDVLVRPGAVEGPLFTMKKDPRIGILGIQLLNKNNTLQHSVSVFPNFLTELTNKSLIRKLFPSKYQVQQIPSDHPIEVDSVIGACMFVRKEAVREVGFFDEQFFFFMEETDWCKRMKILGWKVVHDPRYSVYHLQGETASKVYTKARIEYWKSRYTYFRKYYGEKGERLLKYGLLYRLILSSALLLVANSFCLFQNKNLRKKQNLYTTILRWHLNGCPDDWGLSCRNF